MGIMDFTKGDHWLSSSPPERLFLQVHDNPNDEFAWTHADHRIHDDDVEYVRVARSPEGEDAQTECFCCPECLVAGVSVHDDGGCVSCGADTYILTLAARLRPSVEAPSDDLADALNMIRTMVNLIDKGFPEQAATNGLLKLQTLAPPTGDTP